MDNPITLAVGSKTDFTIMGTAGLLKIFGAVLIAVCAHVRLNNKPR